MERHTIYFAQMGDGGPIKIGKTALGESAYKRLTALQTGNPYKLSLLLEMASTREINESSLHKAFALEWIRGEWFFPSARLMSFIKKLTVASAGEYLSSDQVPENSIIPEVISVFLEAGASKMPSNQISEAIQGATPRKLAKQLKEFGITPKKMRFGNVCKNGYVLEEIKSVLHQTQAEAV